MTNKLIDLTRLGDFWNKAKTTIVDLTNDQTIDGTKTFSKMPCVGQQSELWNRYKPVEYIESSGTQYIDTGVAGSGTTKADIRYQYYQLGSSAAGSGRIFGNRTSSTSNNISFGSKSGNLTTPEVYFFGYGTKSTGDTQIPTIDTNIHDFHYDNTEFKIDGTTYWTTPSATFNTPANLKLFGFDNGGTMGCGIGRCYYCKIFDGINLVRNLVPVLDTETNKYGMYDKVTKQFFGNAGTGDFTGGSEIKRVEYINNGSSGYIMTNLYPGGADKIYVKAATTGDLSANQALFGNYHDGANTKDFVGYFGKDKFYIWRNGAQQYFVAKPQANVIYEFTADYLNGSATVKGENINETITFTPTDFTCSNKLPIGARYNGSYGGAAAYNFYSVKYYRNNILIGDFTPIKLGTEYCMLDTVEWKVYRNAGTGSFTGSDEISIESYALLSTESIAINPTSASETELVSMAMLKQILEDYQKKSS